MKRLLALTAGMLLTLLLVPSAAEAQGGSGFTVSTSVKGARFKVDGQEYTSAASFFWPAGSRHVLEWIESDDGWQYNGIRDTRYQFLAWTDNQSLFVPSGARSITVTAGATVTSFVVNVAVYYKVSLQFFDDLDPSAPGGCSAPGLVGPSQLRSGVVYIGGECFWKSTTLWLAPGILSLNAYPYPGFVFTGWLVNQMPPNDFLREVSISSPASITPLFAPGKRVRFRTDPPGLKVLVDRTVTPTTDVEPCIPNYYLPVGAPPSIELLCVGEFDFLPGSEHTIGAPTPQEDRWGKAWVFDSFSNGVALNSVYTVGNTVQPSETIVAKFVPGVTANFLTQPSGLKLRIDGRENWPAYVFVFAAGTQHAIEAALEQTDAQGRRYRFQGWSQGGERTQQITVPDAPGATVSYVARYELLSQLKLVSNAAGASVFVDGVPCATPCTLDRPAGTDVRLAAPAAQTLTDAHRLEFDSWSDSAARERTFTLAGAQTQVLTLNFRSAYRLAVSSDPSQAGEFSLSPASADGFYPADTRVIVTAADKTGYKFRRWGLDLSGTSRVATVTMAGPRNALALYDAVPAIHEAGVRNAAGDTPEKLVAPGSLITIYGVNLASGSQVGPSSPLAQSLAGVSVMAGSHILPLLFVSPEQINAQLPRELAPGEHTIQILRAGQPPVSGKFQVADCAPGLFATWIGTQPYAAALHEDGTVISPASPARRGERIRVLGTGFGAYTANYPIGFALPQAPALPLLRQVWIQAGAAAPKTLWAGGAPDFVGVDQVEFAISAELPRASEVPLKIVIEGRESNTVLLPVE